MESHPEGLEEPSSSLFYDKLNRVVGDLFPATLAESALKADLREDN